MRVIYIARIVVPRAGTLGADDGQTNVSGRMHRASLDDANALGCVSDFGASAAFGGLVPEENDRSHAQRAGDTRWCSRLRKSDSASNAVSGEIPGVTLQSLWPLRIVEAGIGHCGRPEIKLCQGIPVTSARACAFVAEVPPFPLRMREIWEREILPPVSSARPASFIFASFIHSDNSVIGGMCTICTAECKPLPLKMCI